MNASQPKSFPDANDSDLLHRIALRDAEALLALYRRYNVRVFSLILRIVLDRSAAEELLQDTFQRLWEAYPLFDPTRGTLISWLLTIARNLSLDYRRKTSRRAAFHVYPDSSHPHNLIERHASPTPLSPDLSLSVLQSLEKLPPEQRSAIELAYYEGLSHDELAARLDIPTGTVKSRIRLGLSKMRETLRNCRSLL